MAELSLSSSRKSLKAPIHNPYDKFTQPEFDAWIGGITGALRKALGHVDEEEIPHTNGTASYDDHYVARLAATEDDYYREEDEEAEESHTRNIGKGKARDPRDGPGLGPGTIDEPIELDSDEDEDQEEKNPEEQEEANSEEDEYEEGYEEGDDDVNNAGQYVWDGDEETRENHVSGHVQEDSDLEDEEGVDKEAEADYEWGEDDETRGKPVSSHIQDYSEDEEGVDEAEADYVWEEDDSPSRPYHPAISPTRTAHLKNRQDDSFEEEHYENDRDEVGYNGDYDEDYEGDEYDERQGAEAEPIEISEDEEENDENVPPVRQFKPKREQPGDDVALAEEEDADDDEDIQRESLFYDLKVPHHANMEEDMEDEYGHDQLDEEPLEYRKNAASKLVYERDDSEQPFENNTSFPPPQLGKSPLDQPVSLRDPWDGPSHFAEDFYSGGEVHQSSGTMLDPNHLSELDASSDMAAFLTPGIMTPNVISSDNVPIPSAALLSQTFHPTEDGVMERVEMDEHGQELPDLGLQKGVLAPDYTVENERQVDGSIDGEPLVPARLSEPLTVELQDSEDLYHGLDNFIETLTNSTAHLAHTIQEQDPSSSSAVPDKSQEDRPVNESSGKTLDEDNLMKEEFTEQKDTEVIDVDELDDTDELVEDEGHTVASQLAEEAGPATTASIRRGTDGPLDSPSITQTNEVFGNEGDEMLKSVEEARKLVTSSNELEVDASLDSPSITRADVHEAAEHILQLPSVPVDGSLDVPRKDPAVLTNVPAEAQVEKTVSLNAEIIRVDVNVHDSHGAATLDQQETLDRDNGLMETASETVTLTQKEFHGEPSVDLPSGDMVLIPETVNTNIGTSGRDTFEPSALEVVITVPSMQTLEADSSEDRMNEVEGGIGLQGQTLVESSSSSPQALPSILPDDGVMQEATASGSGVLEVEVEVDAKTETVTVEASEAGVSHGHEDEVDLSEETDQIEEVSGPAMESKPQNPEMETSIPSVQPVSDHTTLVQGSAQEDIPEDSEIPFDPKDGEDELDELAYPEDEPTVSTITDTNPVAGIESAGDNTDSVTEARELVREGSQPIDVDQQASNAVEGPEQNPLDQIDVAMTEPSIYTASNTSTTSTLVGGQNLLSTPPVSSAYRRVFPLRSDPYPASLSTPMFPPNVPAPFDSPRMPDPTNVTQDDLSATSASPDTREQSDDEDGADSDAEGDLDPDYVEVDGVVTPVASTRSSSVPDDIEIVDREPSPVLNDPSFDDADGHSQIQEEFDHIQRDDAELESMQPTTADHFVSPNEIPNSDEKAQPLDDISEVIMDGGKGPQEVTDGDESSGALDVSPSVDTPEVTAKSTVTDDIILDGSGDDIAITENPIPSGELLSNQVAETLTRPGSPDGRGTVDEEKSANDSPIPDILPSTQVAEVVQAQVPEAVTPVDMVNGQRSISGEQMENQIPVKEVDPITETDPFKLMGSQSTVAPGAVETDVQVQHDSNKELAENLVVSTVPEPDDTTTGPTGVHPDSSAPVPPEANASSRGSKRKRKSSNPSQSAISPNKKDSTRAGKPSVATTKGKGKRKQRQDSETPSMSSSGASAAAKLLQPSSRASSVASVATGDGSAFTHTSLATIPPSQFPQLMLHSHSRPRPPPYQPIRPSLSLQTHIQMRGPPTAQSSGGPSHSPDVGPSPSRQKPVARTMTSPTSTRSTRSSCRYHKISLPETDEDNSPDIFFLVPGCSLVDTELIKEEEIKDLGDATLEDSIRKVGDIETLDINNYVLAVIRQLVGPDKEQDVYYLPKLGEERARKVHYKKRKSKKYSRDSGIPDGSFTANGLLSPTSSRAPVSAAGSSSTDASRRKKGNDMDHATVTSYSSGEDSDYDEETRGKRSNKKSKTAHEEISELQSGSQSKVPKRGIKRRLGTDAAEYQPGETDEETDELSDVDSPKRPRKQGKKRTRTDIQDDRQTKRPKVPIPMNGSADGEPFNQDRPLPDPSAGLNLIDMQWPPPQTQSQSHLP